MDKPGPEPVQIPGAGIDGGWSLPVRSSWLRSLHPLVLVVPLAALATLLGGLATGTAHVSGRAVRVTGLAATAAREVAPAEAVARLPQVRSLPTAAYPTGAPGAQPAEATRAAEATQGAQAAHAARAAQAARPGGVARRPAPRPGQPAPRPGPASRPAVAPSPVTSLPAAAAAVPVTVAPSSTASPAVSAAPATPAAASAAAIASVESRGLYPAAGFVVTCPGYALGHEGMTCYNVTGICPGAKEIVISDPQPFVVANEFENSRIFLGLPVRCDTLDCGHAAYGY